MKGADVKKAARYILPVFLVLVMATALVFFKYYPSMDEVKTTGEVFRESTPAEVKNTTIPSASQVSTQTTGGTLTGNELISKPVSDKIAPGKKDNVTGEQVYTSTEKATLGIANTLVLIGLAVAGGFGIYMLFKHRKRMSLRYFFGFAVSLICISTLMYFAWWAYMFAIDSTGAARHDNWAAFVMSVFSIPYGAFLAWVIMSKKTAVRHKNFALLVVGGLMGAFLASLLPIFIVLPFVFLIALYDIYAVKRGLIKKIIDITDEDERAAQARRAAARAPPASGVAASRPPARQVQAASVSTPASAGAAPERASRAAPSPNAAGASPAKAAPQASFEDEVPLLLMYETDEWSLGLGDLVFYSMLCSATVMYMGLSMPYYQFYTPTIGALFPWLFMGVISLAILFGFVMSIKMLSSRSLLPGLPMSIFIGLGVFLASLAAIEIVNFAISGKWVPLY